MVKPSVIGKNQRTDFFKCKGAVKKILKNKNFLPNLSQNGHIVYDK